MVVLGVGLRADGEGLSVALRDNALVTLGVEQVFEREVCELECHLSDDARLSPTGGKFDLVVGFRLEVEDDVHRSVFLVRLRPDVHFLGVEVPGLRNFTCRANEVLLAEQFPRPHPQFAADDLLIQAVVAVNHHLVDAGLLALV